MDLFYKKVQVIALIVILIGVAAFVTRPSYAGGAYSEISYVTKSPNLYPSQKHTKVNLKWSKAYSVLKDGTINDATGYEIQYADNKEFRDPKTVTMSGLSNSTMIDLDELDTQQKYNESVSGYHFRLRSYVRVNGSKQYSKWVNAAESKKVKVYSPVTMESIKIKRNVVRGKWQAVSGADGYVIYQRKDGAAKWEKVLESDNKNMSRFRVGDLEFESKYEFAVLSYKYIVTTDPSELQTSVLHLLDDDTDKYNMSVPEFSLDKPDAKVRFKDQSLQVSWDTVDDSQKYYVEISTDKEFPVSEVEEMSFDALEGVDSYIQDIGDHSKQDKVYVRMRAAGTYKNRLYYSEYSDVASFKYSDATYKVKFISDDLTEGSMDKMTVRVNEVFDLPVNKFSRDGYQFVGWSTKKDSETDMKDFQYGIADYEDGQEVQSLADPGGTTKLFACWKGNSPASAGDWAKLIAENDDFCYGINVVLNQCWYCGGETRTYNCNSFVTAAYTHGMPYFEEKTYGSTSPGWWEKRGFKKLGKIAPSEIKKGDIICCWNAKMKIWKHVMIAYSSTEVVHAARRGEDPDSIRVEDMVTRLGKYSSYCVCRLSE